MIVDMLVVWSLGLVAALQQPTPALHVHNPAPRAQQGALAAALPLPAHWRARTLAGIRVGDASAHYEPRLRWPDGSLAVVEVRWIADLPAQSHARIAVHLMPVTGDDKPALERPPERRECAHAGVDLALRALRFELVDPWGRIYRARPRVERDECDAGFRWCRAHAPLVDDATGAALFAVQVDVVGNRGTGAGELTVVLDNGRIQADANLGPARFRSFALITEDPHLRLRPQHAVENLLPLPTLERAAGGEPIGFRQELFPPSHALYLGDATAKAWRFDYCRDAELSEAARAALATAFAEPPFAFADLDWVRHTGAFGLHGGPAPVRGELDGRATFVDPLLADAEFGPFGGFGAARDGSVLGSRQCVASALHNVLRWRSTDLLRAAQARVLQSLLRPLPGRRPRTPPDTAALRAGLSERAVAQPHGFVALDCEHVEVDVLFEVYWLTGDRLAYDELVRHGQALRRLLPHVTLRTSRGEGQCVRALAAIAWATDDRDLLAWAVQHVQREVLPRLRASPNAALPQPPHPDVLGGVAWFDAPWQMAALVHGLHALHRLSGEPELAAAAVEVARRMATGGWQAGVGPKHFVHAHDPSQFCMPRAWAPLHGSARFAIGAFVLAGELARDAPDLQQLFAERARTVVDAARGPLRVMSPDLRGDTSFQLWLDRNERDDPRSVRDDAPGASQARSGGGR